MGGQASRVYRDTLGHESQKGAEKEWDDGDGTSDGGNRRNAMRGVAWWLGARPRSRARSRVEVEFGVEAGEGWSRRNMGDVLLVYVVELAATRSGLGLSKEVGKSLEVGEEEADER